jgi:ADP-ribosylglycohydrolase
MDLFFKILMAVIAAISVASAIYNIFSSRTIVQEQGQRAKIEQALALGQENKQEIQNIKEQAKLRNDAVDQHLQKIGNDTSWMRDLLTKWLLDPNRKS